MVSQNTKALLLAFCNHLTLLLCLLLVVYIGYPESQVEWNSLFSSMLTERNLDEEVEQLQQQQSDLFSIFCNDLDRAHDFCAADMKAVLDTAHLMSVHEILDNKTAKDVSPQVVIKKQHILDAFRRTRPSLLPSDKIKFQRFFRPFLSDDMKCPPEWDNNFASDIIEDSACIVKLRTALR